jgi:hypothetical protein
MATILPDGGRASLDQAQGSGVLRIGGNRLFLALADKRASLA